MEGYSDHCTLYSSPLIPELNHIVNDMEKYPTSYTAFLASRPKRWENDAIALMIRLCRKYKLDALFVQRLLPWFCGSTKKIVAIHDLTPIKFPKQYTVYNGND